MKKIITAGIDIGSSQVKVVVTEYTKGVGQRFPHIIGTGLAESKGLRHGYLINSADVGRSVRQAVTEAERTAGVAIENAYLSIGGVGLSSVTSKGSVIISKADLEITELDLEKVTEIAQEAIPKSESINRKIVHTIPLEYRIDDKPVLGHPAGMRGVKLEATILFITAIERHLEDLIEATESAGVHVIDVLASPIAASFITLSKAQKMAGCVLANIGAETLSIVVFENNIPISLEVFPIGGADITNDIALGLKISLEEAEEIKKHGIGTSLYPRKKLEEIVEARLNDMFELIDSHLKKIGRSGLLPAGIILTGGSAGVTTASDLAKSVLKLPSRIAGLSSYDTKENIDDAFWSVAYGLCVLGLSENEISHPVFNMDTAIKKIGSWFKQFLP